MHGNERSHRTTAKRQQQKTHTKWNSMETRSCYLPKKFGQCIIVYFNECKCVRVCVRVTWDIWPHSYGVRQVCCICMRTMKNCANRSNFERRKKAINDERTMNKRKNGISRSKVIFCVWSSSKRSVWIHFFFLVCFEQCPVQVHAPWFQNNCVCCDIIHTIHVNLYRSEKEREKGGKLAREKKTQLARLWLTQYKTNNNIKL